MSGNIACCSVPFELAFGAIAVYLARRYIVLGIGNENVVIAGMYCQCVGRGDVGFSAIGYEVAVESKSTVSNRAEFAVACGSRPVGSVFRTIVVSLVAGNREACHNEVNGHRRAA